MGYTTWKPSAPTQEPSPHRSSTEPSPHWRRVSPVLEMESGGWNIPPQLTDLPAHGPIRTPMGTLAPQQHASFCQCCTYATQGSRWRCWPLLFSTGRILPRRDGEVLGRRSGENSWAPRERGASQRQPSRLQGTRPERNVKPRSPDRSLLIRSGLNHSL